MKQISEETRHSEDNFMLYLGTRKSEPYPRLVEDLSGLSVEFPATHKVGNIDIFVLLQLSKLYAYIYQSTKF